MRVPDEVWSLVRRLLVPLCPRCGTPYHRRTECFPHHCPSCCTAQMCVRALRRRHNGQRLWRWTLGQCAFCLRCGSDIGPRGLHWVHDGDGDTGYGAVCPRCGAGEDSLVPVPATGDRRSLLDQWSALAARR